MQYPFSNNLHLYLLWVLLPISLIFGLFLIRKFTKTLVFLSMGFFFLSYIGQAIREAGIIQGGFMKNSVEELLILFRLNAVPIA